MNQTIKDPRACRIPMTEFHHLSLANVVEFEYLDDLLTPVGKRLSRRYQYLLSRSYNPDRGHNRGGAA